MARLLGFWPIFELVAIGQIGSGLLLPASLAPFGLTALSGWAFSATGALVLALMFSWLAIQFPQQGGPYSYVNRAFGPTAAFFTGWTYWLISWISTTAIIAAAVGYLSVLLGRLSEFQHISIELCILGGIIGLNLQGINKAIKTHWFYILFMVLPLIALPAFALFDWNWQNIASDMHQAAIQKTSLNEVILITLWGFIGFETATTATHAVQHPSKTIPLAMLSGTLVVGLVYIISSLGIMGLIPAQQLALSSAPYTDATMRLLGAPWHILITLLAFAICLRAANAWTLAAAQMALGIGREGLLPNAFLRTNKAGAPVLPLIITGLGSIPFLVLTHHQILVEKVNQIIEISVVTFLVIYIITGCAYIKLVIHSPSKMHRMSLSLLGLIAIGFCIWILCMTPVGMLLGSGLFVLSGLPIYALLRFRRSREGAALISS